MANVLVVDDDDDMRRLIKTILERRGHHVREASDGNSGLATFDESRADLVVTDMVMPGLSGLALCEELLRRPSPPKILIVSGRQLHGDDDWGGLAAKGLVKFLGKPFKPAELAQSVQDLVG